MAATHNYLTEGCAAFIIVKFLSAFSLNAEKSRSIFWVRCYVSLVTFASTIRITCFLPLSGVLTSSLMTMAVIDF